MAADTGADARRRDGAAVDRELAANPLYHELYSAFDRLTGVPAVLNMSFNESEPMGNTPEQALACFSRTGMDTLVLGPFLVE